MGHFTLFAKRSLFGAVTGLALLSACTNTELALGRTDAANPRVATAPLPVLARLRSSSDAPPAPPPMPDEHTAPQHDMPAGMEMVGDDVGPVDPHVVRHAAHAGISMGEASPHQATAAPPKAAHWTCTMHPSVDLPKPGKCPICGMKLVQKADNAGDGGAK